MANKFEVVNATTRELRCNQTKSEKILWEVLRNRKLAGKKFLRQHPINFEYQGKTRFFIADFYGHESKLVLELDGMIHENQREYDAFRDYLMLQMGLKVLRIKNEELANIQQVKSRITELL